MRCFFGVAVVLLWSCGGTTRDFGTSSAGGPNANGGQTGSFGGAGDDGGRPSAGAPQVVAGDGGNAQHAEQNANGGDGGAGGAVSTDGCDVTLPFHEPTILPVVNTSYREGKPSLTPDGLTLVFASNRRGSKYDIFMSTRTSLQSDFGAPQALPALAAEAGINLQDPMITSDRSAIYFTSGDGYDDIYVSRASVSDGAFGAPTAVAGVNDPIYSVSPFLNAAGTRLYFVATKDIFVADVSGGTVTNVRAMTTLNSSSLESAIAVSPDELTAYVSTERTDPLARGSSDIWISTRPNLDSEFSTPQPAPELNSYMHEAAGWVSNDGCELYLSRRNADATSADIYVARKGR